MPRGVEAASSGIGVTRLVPSSSAETSSLRADYDIAQRKPRVGLGAGDGNDDPRRQDCGEDCGGKDEAAS